MSRRSDSRLAQDIKFMTLALSLAQAQTGRTDDNPAVGCVLVKNGRIIGKGATADGGRPHGEIVALDCAKHSVLGATAYVTLEPCSHFGRSGPCTAALIESGIGRCVIAAIDPNPKVNWQGAARLQEAGIDTQVGLMQTEAKALMASFFMRFANS